MTFWDVSRYRAATASGRALAQDAEALHPGIEAFSNQDVVVLCVSHDVSFPVSSRGAHAAELHSSTFPCHWEVWTTKTWDDPAPRQRLYEPPPPTTLSTSPHSF